MSQFVEANNRAFTVDAGYPRCTRVKATSVLNQVTVAGPSDRAIGITRNATFNPGDPVAVHLRTAIGTYQLIANGAINAGAEIYPAANGQIGATPNGVPEGIAVSAATAAGDIIEVLLYAPVNTGKLYAAVNTVDTVTNVSVETAFAQSFTFPANFFQPGDRFRIRAEGTVAGHNGSDTLTIKLYIGNLVLVTTGAIVNAANDIFYIDAEVTVRTITSGGTIVAAGVYGDGTPGTVTAKPFSFASATLDSTVAETIKLTATWSAASSSDIVRLDVLNIDRIAA